jgi:hypothetical protein
MSPQLPDGQIAGARPGVGSDGVSSSRTVNESAVPGAGRGASGVGVRGLLSSGLAALVAGLLLWKLWGWAGYPLGAFRPGLDGHGPDPYAWPRLIALWVPLAHWLFALAYALLARWDPRGTLRRHFLADQSSLVLVLPLAGGLLLLGGEGPWQVMVGAWHTLFIGTKAAIFVTGLWRWLSREATPAWRANVGIFLGAFLPYLFLGAHVTTAMSSTGDEPYYLLVAHSLLHDGDADLADNFARRDYLPFYWGELSRNPRAIRTTPGGSMFARLYQGFQPVLLLPGYAVAGRMGAVVTTSLLGAAALVFVFRLGLASGASLRAAFLAWLGAAFSVPFVTYAASPFPEMSGGFFAGAAAYLLWQGRPTWTARVAASLCLVAMVATKTRLFLLAPPLVLGFARRVSWTSLGLAVGALVAAIAAATVYDALFLSGFVVWQSRGGGVLTTLSWLLRWTLRAPLEYRGHLGLLLDQEFGLLVAAPVFALAIAGIVVAVAERRWRLLLLTGGPFLCAWYYLGAARLGGISVRGLSQWYGGFSPPVRFLMATLPLLAVLIALALDRVRGRLGWGMTAALYVATVAYAAVVSVWPAWRFQHGSGRAVLALALFRRVGLDPGRFLPSFITPGAGWEWLGVGALALTVAVGYMLARGPGREAPSGTWLTGAVTALLCVVVLVAISWVHPSGAYPAVLGVGRDGVSFWGPLTISSGSETATREGLVWATQRSGALELAPRLRPGRYRVTVRVGSQGVDSGPSLMLQLGTDPPQRVGLEGALPPAWREQEYGGEVHWSGGRLPIRLELGQVSRQDPLRLAYVDTVEIQRLR